MYTLEIYTYFPSDIETSVVEYYGENAQPLNYRVTNFKKFSHLLDTDDVSIQRIRNILSEKYGNDIDLLICNCSIAKTRDTKKSIPLPYFIRVDSTKTCTLSYIDNELSKYHYDIDDDFKLISSHNVLQIILIPSTLKY